MQVRIRDPGSCKPWIREWKNSDPESGINIPDPQHCGKENEKLNAWNGLKEPYSPRKELGYLPLFHVLKSHFKNSFSGPTFTIPCD
jgi:hypothetical protein